MEKDKKKLILIDSNALVHRAYHALPPLTKKDGTLTNAVYGYALTLLSVLEKFKPDYILATFDLAGPTFRHEEYKEYKAHRKKADDELYAQIPMVKDLLRAFNIPIYEKAGFEADDVIGTLAKSPKFKGLEKIIVTGDLDTLQLVDEETKVFTLRRGITDTVIYDIEKVKERYGLEPWQMVEYKALRGDQSDNIPGVKGIGEKTAIELLLKYENVENVYKNLEYISSASVKKKLELGKESAELSRKLATIDVNVPVDFELNDCFAADYDKEQLLKFLNEMEFYSLAKRIEGKGELKNQKSKGKIKSQKAKFSDKNETIESMNLNIKVVNKEKEVEEIVNEIKKVKRFSFSICNSEDRYFSAEVYGVGLSYKRSKEIIVIPKKQLMLLAELFEDQDIYKIGYNLKFEYEVFNKFGIKEINNFFDVQIAAYLLKSGLANDLEKLIFEEFGKELEYRIVKKGQISLLDNSEKKFHFEAAEKAYWILELEKIYKKRLEEISNQQQEAGNKHTLSQVLSDLENPLIKILAKMEMAGVKINKQALTELSETAEKEIKQLETQIYQLADISFNINSPSQLAEILYVKLGISTVDIKKGKTGYSTDADQLRKIRLFHPIVALVEQYRELAKVKNTYTDALPVLVEDDGRIHAKFNQAIAATGRLSSSDPNLQNIPKRGKLAKLIRESFIAEQGYSFVAADYSQIDLRTAAHLADDDRLIEAFQTGKDIHRATAAWVNGIKEEEVTDVQRREAKSLNFGVLYGMGIYGFMRDSGVDRKRAEFFIEQYMKRFSNLKKFLDQTKELARKNGYVETELGRRRYIPNLNAKNFQLRNAAERMAINLPVQGLAADIMKLAMIEVQKQVLLNYDSQDARLILQIHDELIFEVKDALIDKFKEEVKEVMENVYKLKVPLLVEVESGKNWGEV